MAAIETNPDLLLRAFIETARDLFEDPKPWLKSLRNQALTGNTVAIEGVLSNLQDWGATGVASESSSTQWLRELSAITIAQLAQAALDVIKSDDSAGGVDLGSQSDIRYSDFSGRPCVLG